MEAGTASSVIVLDPFRNRTGDVWHVWRKGIRPGQLYGYLIDGPYRPELGHRYNPNKLLLDPYSSAIGYRAIGIWAARGATIRRRPSVTSPIPPLMMRRPFQKA